MIITIILFVLGFAFLLKGADILVEGASSIAKRYNISDLVIGLTIVSFGTSAPELIINILSTINGNPDIAMGNILGSNIANILLILGISSIIYGLPIQRSTVLSEIPFSLTATILVGFLANANLFGDGDQVLSRNDGFILLFFFGLFMSYIFKLVKESPDNNEVFDLMPLRKALTYITLGILGLFFGGKWVVDGAILFAKMLGMSEIFIGLTIVAIGTALPELITSVVAAYRRNADIAVGNVVGSNIFNLLWVLGISSVITPIPFHINGNYDILVMIISSTMLFFAMAFGKRYVIERWGGILFILTYIYYLYTLILRG